MKRICAIVTGILLLIPALSYSGLYLADWAYEKGYYGLSQPVYEPLAELGIEFYQMRVGWMYLKGRGAPKDYSKAAKWYRGPAINGNPEAQFVLGVLYSADLEELGGRDKAFAWLVRSASQGHKHAQAAVSSMYASGRDIAPDMVQAYKWMIIATDGELPTTWGGLPSSFGDGGSPEQIAKAKHLADEWIARNRRKP